MSAPTVGKLLRDNGFSLQANAKALEGKQHPDRDAQFGYLNEQTARCNKVELATPGSVGRELARLDPNFNRSVFNVVSRLPRSREPSRLSSVLSH